MNQQQKAQLIKDIVAKARTIREVINLRSELTCLKTDEVWTFRAKFTINYFKSRDIDVFEPANTWNEEHDKLLGNAWVLYQNKGQQILDDNIKAMSTYSDGNWELEMVDEDTIPDDGVVRSHKLYEEDE